MIETLMRIHIFHSQTFFLSEQLQLYFNGFFNALKSLSPISRQKREILEFDT